jgi:hypothetical protein
MEIINKTIVGSQLYGLATKDSDTDVKGIFMPNKENMIPSKEQILGIDPFTPHQKQMFDNGLEGTERVEGILYSAKYFIELYMKGNPTLAEIPFASEKYILEQTDLGKRIMTFVRENMVTRHLFGGYMGFFNDQLKAFDRGKGRSREKRLRADSELPKGFNIPAELEAEFNKGDDAKKGTVEDVRHLLISQGWYDGKMMSHAYRIGYQGVELFRTGSMKPTLEGESLDIALRMKNLGDVNGHPDRISREDAIEIVTKLGSALEDAKNNSPLAQNPNENKVNNFLIEFQDDYYGNFVHPITEAQNCFDKLKQERDALLKAYDIALEGNGCTKPPHFSYSDWAYEMLHSKSVAAD